MRFCPYCARDYTFIRWVLGFLASSDKRKVVASKEHLNMPDSTLKKLCNPNTTLVNFRELHYKQWILNQMTVITPMLSWFTFSKHNFHSVLVIHSLGVTFDVD